LPIQLESILLAQAKKLVIDYDDPLFLRYSLGFWPWKGKIETLVRRADIVTAANPVLIEYAKEAGARRVEFIPTVVHCPRYDAVAKRNCRGPVVVGWVGTPQTASYIDRVAPAIVQLINEGLVEFRVVGADNFSAVPGSINIRWSEATEGEEICDFDIGIMPLEDDAWSKGKSGFKLIQYMAARRPVVASPVGFNVNIVNESGAGFLASTPREWIDALRVLIGSAELRRKMGEEGRAYVERKFSLDVVAPRLVRLFLEL